MIQPWLSLFPSLSHRTCSSRGSRLCFDDDEGGQSDDERGFWGVHPGVLQDRTDSPPSPLPAPAAARFALNPLFLGLAREAATHLAAPGCRAGQDGSVLGWAGRRGWERYRMEPSRRSHPRLGAQPCGAGMSCVPGTRLGSARHSPAALPWNQRPSSRRWTVLGGRGGREGGWGGHADIFFCV